MVMEFSWLSQIFEICINRTRTKNFINLTRTMKIKIDLFLVSIMELINESICGIVKKVLSSGRETQLFINIFNVI